MLQKLLYLTAVILAGLIASTQGQTAASVCGQNECTYGTCEILSVNQFACHCIFGITGRRCNMQAAAGNPCSSNPCFNNGLCTNVGTTFQCSCPVGTGGPTCQGHLGTCICQNGAQCITQTVNGVTINTCQCAVGFGGNLCQFSVSNQNCFAVGCQNGGSCNFLGTCNCPTGFTGRLCELSATATIAPVVPGTNTGNIALCFNGICQNGGACSQLSSNIATCTCVNGFTGIYCNVPPANPTVATTTTTTTTTTAGTQQACPVGVTLCQNNGTCTFNTATNQLLCNCLPNFSGPTCAVRAPFCSVNPCQNGGSCTTTNVPVAGDGTCACLPGFSGNFCDISSCDAATTCQGRGVCVTNAGVQTCLCFAGFTGNNCEVISG